MSKTLRGVWPASQHDLLMYQTDPQIKGVFAICKCTQVYYGANQTQAKDCWMSHVEKMYLDWRDKNGIDA